MAKTVQLLTDDDGEKVTDSSWHYRYFTGGSPTVLCTGEVFGEGESPATFTEKDGKVTCKKCIAIIKEFKAIKL